MTRSQYPTLEEFWKRLAMRGVENDLQEQLRLRLRREERPVKRVGQQDTVVAVAARLVPGDVPPVALAAFLDEAFTKQLGRADDKAGLLPRQQLIPAGFVVLESAAVTKHGTSFAALESKFQDDLLSQMEQGTLQGPEGFDSSVWFKRTRALLLLGYGSDPRGMVQMGFPGPSYKPGHLWLDEAEVAARAARKRDYLRL